jgi:hypothetical protein
MDIKFICFYTLYTHSLKVIVCNIFRMPEFHCDLSHETRCGIFHLSCHVGIQSLGFEVF